MKSLFDYMSLTDEILLIASLLTALGVIIATAIKIYKFIRKWEKWVEEQSEHNLDNYLSIKRLTIMSQEMPLSERISAGENILNMAETVRLSINMKSF